LIYFRLFTLFLFFNIPISAHENINKAGCNNLRNIAVTAWGGQMTDSVLRDSLTGIGVFETREEFLAGIGFSQNVFKFKKNLLNIELNYFKHFSNTQKGGRFNQKVKHQKLKEQNFSEFVLGVGFYKELNSSFKIGLIEGISYLSENSYYEKTFRSNYSQILNYLGFEIEKKITDDFHFVSRIHHRSGAFGMFGGVKGGSNGYLIGLRYVPSIKSGSVNNCNLNK